MKTAVLSSDNKVVLKIGYTKAELEKILAGNASEFQFDKFHSTTYHILIKLIKDK